MRLPLAVSFGLFALPAVAQLPDEAWFTPCDGPEPTCLSPRVSNGIGQGFSAAGGASRRAGGSCGAPGRLEEIETGGGTGWPAPLPSVLTPIADDAREMLGRWEAASRGHLPVPGAEWLRLRYDDPRRTGQEVGLACELQGPIDAADLLRRYDWAVTDDADAVVLTAVPTDAVERLFYERLCVTLDAATWRPASVRFVKAGGDAGTTVALRPWVDEEVGVGSIETVAFETADEAEGGLVRTADLSGDAPRLLRDESPLALPPAPVPCDFVTPLEPVEAPRPVSGG